MPECEGEQFSVVAAYPVLTFGTRRSCFTIGLLERKDKTIWRMGYDAAGALLLFCGGMLLMARFSS